MKIEKPAIAGTLESSDCMVTVEPGNGTITMNLESAVMNQFGEQIQKVVTTPKTIGFYYETEKALIVPKPDFGDKFVPILTLATKKLGSARVHLR